MANDTPYDNGPINQQLVQREMRRLGRSEDDLFGTSIKTPDGKPMRPGHVDVLEEIKQGGIERAPTLLAAVKESHIATGLSYDMLFLTAVAASSVAVQTVADCNLPYGTCPSGVIVHIVGESGVGKSPAIIRLTSFIEKLEKHANNLHIDRVKAYKATKASWEEKKAKLAKAYRKVDCGDDDVSPEQIRYEAHIRAEPVEPRPIRVRITNGTQEGISACVAENEAGVGLINAEAAQFLQGRGVATLLAYLAAWWSGEGYRDLRATPGLGAEATDPRITVLLACQPEVMGGFQVGKGKLSRSIGYFGRSISCRISEGSRSLPNPADVGLRKDTDVLMDRLHDLLVEGYSAYPKSVERRLVGLSEKAQQRWDAYREWVHAQTGKLGLYEHAKDYAAKHPETVMRIAVIIHVVEGFEGDISEDTIGLALDIGKALSGEFLAIFRCIDGIDTVGDDLYRYLKAKAADTKFSSPKRFISISAIANKVPNHIRNGLLKPAIENLVQRGLIGKVIYKRALFIDLEPGELIQDGEVFWYERAIVNNKK